MAPRAPSWTSAGCPVRSPISASFPNWLARWLEVVPSVATLAVQAGAAVAVLGSYLVAEHLKVRRPRSRGEQAAARPEQPPLLAEQAA